VRYAEYDLRNAVRRLSPAGPPPTQTTSKISGRELAMVAYLLAPALIILAQDRQILDCMAVTRLGVLMVPLSGVWRRACKMDASFEIS
jgi:hypothetical protein